MKINIKNEEKINAILNEVQKGCSVRKIEYYDIKDAIKRIERKLETTLYKKDWQGLIFEVNEHAQQFASSYNATPYSTYFTIERGASGWFVTRIERDPCGRTFIKPKNIHTKSLEIANFAIDPKNWS